MRTIKFRAWDADFCKMIYEPTKDGYSVDIQSGILEVGLTDGDGDYVALPLMQFTGLLDKNGKEIYENDIVRLIETIGENIPQEYIGIIEFESGCFWFHARGRSENCWFHHNKEDIEVIGNRFENPELLS